jgi:hypothetical protein
MQYYGTRLSENISRREPEGYLLCLNVPVARTGTQEYLPEELGLPAGNGPPGLIPVIRPEEEVFSPETIASFEGMPVTNDHPPDGVDIGNIKALQKGHAHNVRRGSGEERDLLLADLIITDPVLIGLIMDGKREISCGYTYELCEENGKYIQRRIRGNHVAVVDAGRAGPRVCIKDQRPERRKRTMKKSLSKILARMAKDGDIETVAEIIEEMIESESPETPEEAIGEAVAETIVPAAAEIAEETEAAPEEATDEATLADIVSRLDRIIELLTPGPASDEDPVEEIAEAVEEAIEAATAEEEPAADEETGEIIDPEEVAEIVEEILEPVPAEALSEVLDPVEDECGEEEEESLTTGDALRVALKAVKPVLAKMPRKQRMRVSKDIAARLQRQNSRRGADAGIYAAIAGSRRKAPRKNPADLGKRIMANRNINCRK